MPLFVGALIMQSFTCSSVPWQSIGGGGGIELETSRFATEASDTEASTPGISGPASSLTCPGGLVAIPEVLRPHPERNPSMGNAPPAPPKSPPPPALVRLSPAVLSPDPKAAPPPACAVGRAGAQG